MRPKTSRARRREQSTILLAVFWLAGAALADAPFAPGVFAADVDGDGDTDVLALAGGLPASSPGTRTTARAAAGAST